MPDEPRSPGEGPRQVDPRPLRFEQGVMALLLLAGFAFRAELVIPITTVLLAISGAVGPEREPIAKFFAIGVTERLGPPAELADAQTLRLAILVQTGVLLVASLIGFLGLETLAWLVALVVAGGALYDATTGTWTGARLYWRFVRRRRA
jgi:hypothetical protein